MSFFKSTVPAAFALALLATEAAHASEHHVARPFGSVSAKNAVTLSDVSAAQQKKKRPTGRAQPAPPPSYGAPGWGGWRPADPSFDQNGRPYQPPPGLACPVDLGYGRWGSCNDDY